MGNAFVMDEWEKSKLVQQQARVAMAYALDEKREARLEQRRVDAEARERERAGDRLARDLARRAVEQSDVAEHGNDYTRDAWFQEGLQEQNPRARRPQRDASRPAYADIDEAPPLLGYSAKLEGLIAAADAIKASPLPPWEGRVAPSVLRAGRVPRAPDGPGGRGAGPLSRRVGS